MVLTLVCDRSSSSEPFVSLHAGAYHNGALTSEGEVSYKFESSAGVEAHVHFEKANKQTLNNVTYSCIRGVQVTMVD